MTIESKRDVYLIRIYVNVVVGFKRLFRLESAPMLSRRIFFHHTQVEIIITKSPIGKKVVKTKDLILSV
jgi:hypothetical protein